MSQKNLSVSSSKPTVWDGDSVSNTAAKLSHSVLSPLGGMETWTVNHILIQVKHVPSSPCGMEKITLSNQLLLYPLLIVPSPPCGMVAEQTEQSKKEILGVSSPLGGMETPP